MSTVKRQTPWRSWFPSSLIPTRQSWQISLYQLAVWLTHWRFPRARESESMVANGRFAMRPGLTLRGDYDAACLRGLARRTKSAAQGRRLLALAEIYDAGSRTKAACVGGGGLQTDPGRGLGVHPPGPPGAPG